VCPVFILKGETMKYPKGFYLKVNDQDKQNFVTLAAYMRRSQCDAIRELVRVEVERITAEKKTAKQAK
jgi:hypothetical protein